MWTKQSQARGSQSLVAGFVRPPDLLQMGWLSANARASRRRVVRMAWNGWR